MDSFEHYLFKFLSFKLSFKVVSPIVTKKLSINFPPYQKCNLFPDGQTCATSYTIHTTTVFQSGRLAVFVSLFS